METDAEQQVAVVPCQICSCQEEDAAAGCNPISKGFVGLCFHSPM